MYYAPFFILSFYETQFERHVSHFDTFIHNEVVLSPYVNSSAGCSAQIYIYIYTGDRLCGLVVRVPGYTTEMYCV
jgi:hypothetical protein